MSTYLVEYVIGVYDGRGHAYVTAEQRPTASEAVRLVEADPDHAGAGLDGPITVLSVSKKGAPR